MIGFTPKQEAEQRRAVCNACPHNVVGICGKCGCPIINKVNLKRATCPAGKWKGESNEPQQR